jgi:hypothetical protein
MPKYQVIDRDGRVVERDEDEILRDGERLRTSMSAMDAMQRDIVGASRKKAKAVEENEEGEGEQEDSAMTANTFTDSRGVTFVDHRIADTQRALARLHAHDQKLRQLYRDGRAAVEEARQAMIDEMRLGPDAAPPPDNCQPVTRQDAKAAFDARPTYDAVEGERRKREAYQQMVRDLQTRGI